MCYLISNFTFKGSHGGAIVEDSDYEGENDSFDGMNIEDIGPISKVEIKDALYTIDNEPHTARKVDLGKSLS